MSKKSKPILSTFACGVSLAWRAVADSFRVAPGLASTNWALALAFMVAPASQVAAVRGLSTLADPAGGRPASWVLVGVIAIATGTVVLVGLLGTASRNVDQLLRLRLRGHYNSELARGLTAMTPEQSVDQGFLMRVREARDAVPFNVAWQASSVTTIVGALVAMVALAVSLWGLNPLAAVLIPLALVPELFTYSRIARVENAVWEPQARVSRRTEYLEQLQNYPPGATEVAAASGNFGIVAELTWGYAEQSRLMAVPTWTALRLGAASLAVVALLVAGAFWSIVAGGGDAASIFAALIGVVSGLAVTKSAGSAVGETMASTPLIAKYWALLDDLGPDASAPAPVRGGYQLTGVGYSYPGTDSAQVADVSLTLRPGTITALVGDNGAGKTTLAKIIAGIIEPTSGEISTLDGNTTTGAQRLASCSMVFQDFTRFEVTVRRFVDPDLTHDDAAVTDALRRARMWDLFADWPDGVDTQLGPQWSGRGLSGGQWQRLALARTYLSRAPIWLLDEPTAAIDADTEQAIYCDLADQRRADTTVVIVTHRPHLLTGVDHIAVLADGRITELGSYADIIGQDHAPSFDTGR